MSEAIASWLTLQQKSVEVSGRHAERLTLVGPDDKPWGHWGIKEKGLAGQIETLMVALSEQLPTGKHRGQLVVHDNKGEQWAAFPVVMSGRNSNAATAAQETRTLQQATAIAIANFETITVAYRNALEALGARLELALEDNAALVETVQSFQTDNIEVQLKIREHEERKQRMDRLVELAGPPLAMLASHFGEKVISRALASQKKKEAKANAADAKPEAGAGEQSGGGSGQSGPSEPANGHVVGADVQQQGTAEGDGSANSAGPNKAGTAQHRRGHGTDVKATIAAPPLSSKVARAKARATRTKPLTRKGKKR